MKIRYFTILIALLVAVPTVRADDPNFEDDVKPIFRDHCLGCHNSDDAEAGLDLSSFAGVIKGSSSGKIVSAGRPDSSLLYQAITHAKGTAAMPPESPKMADSKLLLIQDWIRAGLIQGKGGKSQLRSIAKLKPVTVSGDVGPLPRQWEPLAVTSTVRPPLPQALAASPGTPLVAVSGQEQVLLFQGPAYRLFGALPFPEGTIHSIRFSRNGQLLLAAGGRGGHSGRAVLFDVVSGNRLGSIGDEVDSVLAADISVDHQFVALGGPAKTVKLFSTQTGKLLHKLGRHTDWITAVRFSPDGKFLATGDRSGGVHVWETRNGGIVFTLDEHKVRVTDVAWRADGAIIATSAEDGNLILWSTKDGFPLRNMVAHVQKTSPRYSRRTGVVAVDYAPDGQLVTAGRDGRVRTWKEDGQATGIFEGEGGLPLQVSFLPEETIVASYFDGSLVFFDSKTRKIKQRLSTQVVRGNKE